MNPTVAALLGYIVVMLGLLGTLGMMRVGLTLGGKRAPNSFSPDGADVSPFSNRLCRAHANSYEGFPIFGGLMLLAIALDATAIEVELPDPGARDSGSAFQPFERPPRSGCSPNPETRTVRPGGPRRGRCPAARPPE